jgi:uncharacterized protein YndB with AHSA1/START domain
MTMEAVAEYGTMTRIEAGCIVRFERDFSHPIDLVWAALTNPERIAEWLAPGDIEPKPGGRLELRFTQGDTVATGEVIAAQPPVLLEHTWQMNDSQDGSVRWELQSDDGLSTRLILTHTLPRPDDRFDYLAGWHTHLDLLRAALNGLPEPFSWETWNRLKDYYTENVR